MKLPAHALPRWSGLLVLGWALASSTPARAESPAERAALAQGLYDSAAELIKAGKFVEACPKLEESQRLDPAMGTQFFLAGCYEKTGRPTSAWSLFLEVAAAAKAAGNTVRENTARGRAAALEPKLPRLRVVLTDASTPGLEVLRDGVPLKQVAWGAPIPVDLGAHTVQVRAPGRATWETKVTVKEPGEKVDVTVPVLGAGAQAEVSAPAPPPPSPTPAPEPVASGMSGQRVAAVVTGALGLGGIVAGSALGAMAGSAWSQAKAGCPAMIGCSAAAHDDSVKSVSLATGSTVALAVGGAAVAGAVILWFTAPSRTATAQLRVVPVAGPGVGAVFFKGAF